LNITLGKGVVKLASGEEENCLIAFYSRQSLTDCTREMPSTMSMVKDQDSARNFPQQQYTSKDPTATEAQLQSSTGEITRNVKVCTSELHLAESSSMHALLAHDNTEARIYGVLPLA
jgi:hypothetical protein